MDNVNQKYYDKFCELEAKYDEYFELLCSVEIMSDNKLFEYYRKEKAKLEKVVSAFKEYKNLLKSLWIALSLDKLAAQQYNKALFPEGQENT